MYWGAGRDSRYSGARRGMGHQGHWEAPRGVGGHYRGVWVCRGCIGGWQRLGTQGPEVI